MAKANQFSIPYLDPSVQHVGISRLRALNVTQLRDLDKTLVIQDNDKPLAVLLKYEHFLAMQERVSARAIKSSVFQESQLYPIRQAAHGKCQCQRTTCGHKGRCANELIDGDWKPRQIKKDPDNRTVGNAEALCRRCFNQAEVDTSE
jgi:hypothetical protein